MTALDLMVKLLMGFEGCILHAYPDPASDLAKALRKRGLWRAVLYKAAPIPDDLAHLDGGPWTIGFGETEGVVPGMRWTKAYALERLRIRAAEFLAGMVKRCPALRNCHYKVVAACGSLAYNIGLGAFGGSVVAACIKRGEMEAAAAAFWRWRFAGGEPILAGRREAEKLVFLAGVAESRAEADLPE